MLSPKLPAWPDAFRWPNPLKSRWRAGLAAGVLLLLAAGLGLSLATALAMQAPPDELAPAPVAAKARVYDRHGQMLNTSYAHGWNLHDQVPLHAIPEFLQQAIIAAEDQRFFHHHGVDWRARGHALWQNLRAGRRLRGASTLSEQVVKMLHPRPRTLWSRWLEGWEARALEQRFGKHAVLAFYLNQVPYRAQRRGVVQAARGYFGRDLSSLNEKEMLALAVMPRAPTHYRPEGEGAGALDAAIARLAARLPGDEAAQAAWLTQNLSPAEQRPMLEVSHFLEYLLPRAAGGVEVHSTLDAELQASAQAIVDAQLQRLVAKGVSNAALLVVDHRDQDILAWVVGRAGSGDAPGHCVNAVLVPRQPGSTLKPFLYAQALDKGWTAATLIDDDPTAVAVGSGLHAYRNYSGRHYGPVTLREALGNSLNIPAIKAVQFVGAGEFFRWLHALGLQPLGGSARHHGEGLALGNGEVSLFALVQAYSTLARMGSAKPLRAISGQGVMAKALMNPDIASLISDILADPWARAREFGRDSVLNFPQHTAVKTGTSSDYRDAWALGYNHRFTVGVWMGNLDAVPMRDVTGSIGPALVLRSVFNHLDSRYPSAALYRSPALVKRAVCADSGVPADGRCAARDEWFLPRTLPVAQANSASPAVIRLEKPTPGLRLAMDPRIPDSAEMFEFSLSDDSGVDEVRWFINKEHVATTTQGRYRWPLRRGQFNAYAELRFKNGEARKTASADYVVQ